MREDIVCRFPSVTVSYKSTIETPKSVVRCIENLFVQSWLSAAHSSEKI